jgi:hypothetical protein
MIFGRPPNLIVGAFQAVLGAGVIILANLVPPVDIPSSVVGAVVVAFGAVIALIANQTPTVNEGSDINVVTKNGDPNKTVTV